MVASIDPSLWLFVIGLLAAAAGTLILAIYTTVRNDGDRTLQAFTVLAVTLFVWTAGNGARLLAPSLGAKLIWTGVLYIGIVLTPVAWLVFTLLYTGRSRYVRPLSVGALLLVPASTLAILYSNQLHGLFYESVSLTNSGPTPILTTTAGPYWWVHFGYSYAIIGVGIVLLVRFAMVTDRLYRTQTAALVGAAFLPLGANLFTIFWTSSGFVVDLTPLAFALSVLALFVAVFFGRFLHLVPVAHDAVVQTLEDGIIVVDESGQILSANEAAREIVSGHQNTDRLVGSELSAVEPTMAVSREVNDLTGHHGVASGFEASTIADGAIEWYWVRRVELTTSTTKSGSVVTVTDITEQKRFERRLRKLQRTHQRLIVAEDEDDIADIAVEAAKEVLGLPITGIWKHDESESVLEPYGMTADGFAVLDEQPVLEPGESLAWEAFASDELQTYTDLSDNAAVHNPETPLQSEILVPIGDWGVIASGSATPSEFRDVDFDLLRLLAAAVESALSRAEREHRIHHLQRRTSSLIRGTSTDEIAREAVSTADEVLGLPLSGIHLLSDDETVLEGTAVTTTIRGSFGAAPAYRRDGSTRVERVLWNVFEDEEVLVAEDVQETDIDLGDNPVRSLIIHPLDEHGVFITSSPEPNAFDRTDRALAELLATTVTAALDRVERERELREREQELRLQNERLEEFTGVISHDLRSPLNQSDIYLDMLASEYDDERIDKAIAANERANEMLEGLLSLARQGKTVEDPETDELATTVRNAWGSVPTPAGSLEMADPLGPLAADHSRLRQVFENLFRNAVEHGVTTQQTEPATAGTAGDGESVTIRVGLLDEHDGIYVADDGPGVPEELRDEVFDHGYTSDGSGTGFGLAIVKRIVDAHGWTIVVTEGADGGARFELRGTPPIGEPTEPNPQD